MLHARAADGVVLDGFCFGSCALGELAQEFDLNNLRASAVTRFVAGRCLRVPVPLDEALEGVPCVVWASLPEAVFEGVVGFCGLPLVGVPVRFGVAAFCFLAVLFDANIAVEAAAAASQSFIFALRASSEIEFCLPIRAFTRAMLSVRT